MSQWIENFGLGLPIGLPSVLPPVVDHLSSSAQSREHGDGLSVDDGAGVLGIPPSNSTPPSNFDISHFLPPDQFLTFALDGSLLAPPRLDSCATDLENIFALDSAITSVPAPPSIRFVPPGEASTTTLLKTHPPS